MERTCRAGPGAAAAVRPGALPAGRVVRPHGWGVRVLLRVLRLGRERSSDRGLGAGRRHAGLLPLRAGRRRRARLEGAANMKLTLEDFAANANAYLPGPNVDLEERDGYVLRHNGVTPHPL